MTLQIGSKEHQREGHTGETWKVPVGNFTERAALTHNTIIPRTNGQLPRRRKAVRRRSRDAKIGRMQINVTTASYLKQKGQKE